MGWLYSSRWPTAAAMRDHLRQELVSAGHTIKKDALVAYGRRYYAAVTSGAGGRTCIGVFLINSYVEDGVRWFGYKDMDEFSGPCEVDCPLSVLDAADPLDTPEAWGYTSATEGGFKYATDWRAAVRKYWADKAAARALAKGVKRGDKLWLSKGRANPYTVSYIEGRRILGYAADGRGPFRIPKSWISRVEPEGV